MCPLWPLHIVFFYFLTLLPVWVACKTAPLLLVSFNPQDIKLHIDESNKVNVTIKVLKVFDKDDELSIYSNSDHIASTDFVKYRLKKEDLEKDYWYHQIEVTGNFLGKTSVEANVESKQSLENVKGEGKLDVVVIRKERVIDTVFTASVATLVSLIYINFGCALDWPKVVATLKRPVGPLIGFFCQFVFMPLISFGLGQLLFPDNVAMQLGMFFTGVSPGGGASNIWTFILGGNLDLSITMTTVSTLAAFGMMPLWLFTLGRYIFESGDLGVPYRNIATFAVGLVIPLGIGFLCQKKLPRFSALMVRILKPFSSLLLIFIIVFAIVTNLYLFELFSWQIIIAGMGVPWLGYMFGYLLAWVFKQQPIDCLAVGLETGIQNTGIAIFLLRFSLPQPEADLTTVVPVSVAIMTPVPLLLLYIYQLGRDKCFSRNKERLPQYETDLMPHSLTQETIIPNDKY